jgi:hypothetical protein
MAARLLDRATNEVEERVICGVRGRESMENGSQCVVFDERHGESENLKSKSQIFDPARQARKRNRPHDVSHWALTHQLHLSVLLIAAMGDCSNIPHMAQMNVHTFECVDFEIQICLQIL